MGSEGYHMDEKTILIADDALFMRKMVRNTLAEAEYSQFIEASNGVEAVEAFRNASHIDLVFLDVTMPEKDGIEALADIMKIDPEAKVVMCSAIGQDATVMEAIRSGANEFIVKPFKKERIIEVATGLIG